MTVNLYDINEIRVYLCPIGKITVIDADDDTEPRMRSTVWQLGVERNDHVYTTLLFTLQRPPTNTSERRPEAAEVSLGLKEEGLIQFSSHVSQKCWPKARNKCSAFNT